MGQRHDTGRHRGTGMYQPFPGPSTASSRTDGRTLCTVCDDIAAETSGNSVQNLFLFSAPRLEACSGFLVSPLFLRAGPLIVWSLGRTALGAARVAVARIPSRRWGPGHDGYLETGCATVRISDENFSLLCRAPEHSERECEFLFFFASLGNPKR